MPKEPDNLFLLNSISYYNHKSYIMWFRLVYELEILISFISYYKQ